MQTEQKPASIAALAVLRRACLGIALLAASAAALPCGPRVASRGGQVNDDQGEMNFELVERGRNVAVYLQDHGNAVSTRGASAVMEVQRGQTGWTAPLRADGERFVAAIPAALARGDRVSVDVRFLNGSIAQGRFSVGIEPMPRRPAFGFAPQTVPARP